MLLVNEIFAEHITYAGHSVCFYLSNLFRACSMYGTIPQQCMKIVIVFTFKHKNDVISDAGISVQLGDTGYAVASPTLKNWPLFGQKFSKFGQSI